MRKTILSAGMAALCLSLILPQNSNAQLLNWLSSYLPAWSNGNTSGTATNISSTGVNCTTNISLSGGSFTLALGSSGSQTPTVSGATFTVPGSTSRLQITPNFATNTNYCNIVMTFNTFVTNVSFRIVDIDKSTTTSTTYYDRVTVTGSDGVNTYNATLTKYDATTEPNFLIISGNTARVNTTSGLGGNTNSDATDQRGTVTASFGSLGLKTVTIRYDNAPGADANPAAQAIGIGSMSFVPSSTLPVSLSSFTGAQQGNDILLKWTTAQELNAASFVLERNNGNNNWHPIATIVAGGISNQPLHYSYTDINPEKATLFYRIKQIDFDGNYKYSSIVRMANKDSRAEMLAYPNPFGSQINISIYSPVNQPVTVKISDAAGRKIMSSVRTLNKGNNNFSMADLEKLQRGIYLVEVLDPEKRSIGYYRLIKN